MLLLAAVAAGCGSGESVGGSPPTTAVATPPAQEAASLHQLIKGNLAVGDLASAQQNVEQLLALARRAGDFPTRARAVVALGELGSAYAQRGLAAQASATLDRMDAERDALPANPDPADSRAKVALALLGMQAWAEAHDSQRVRALYESTQTLRAHEATREATWIHEAFAAEELFAAGHVGRAFEVAAGIASPHQVLAWELVAAEALRTRQPSEARRALDAATTSARSLSDPGRRARAEHKISALYAQLRQEYP